MWQFQSRICQNCITITIYNIYKDSADIACIYLYIDSEVYIYIYWGGKRYRIWGTMRVKNVCQLLKLTAKALDYIIYIIYIFLILYIWLMQNRFRFKRNFYFVDKLYYWRRDFCKQVPIKHFITLLPLLRHLFLYTFFGTFYKQLVWIKHGLVALSAIAVKSYVT